jgi:hypothetical protein
VRRVSVAHGYWFHTFQLELPKPLESWRIRRPPTPSMGNSCEATTATMCYRMRQLVYATGHLTYTMQVSITNTINRIYDLIPDVSSKTTSRRLKTRCLIDAVGQVQSWLFGLTTEIQTRELKDAIEKIKGIVDLTAADASHVKHAMATYTKFDNERMNNMKEPHRTGR